MSPRDNYIDPEDMFADTRMSFGDHLEELRLHLIRALLGFFVGMFLSFFVGKQVVQIIAAPVEEQLGRYYDKRVEGIAAELEQGNQNLELINKPIQVKLTFDRGELVRQLFPEGQAPPGAAEGEPVALNAWIAEPLKFVISLHKAQQIVGRRPTLTTLSIQEAFVVYFKVCIVTGFVISSPWVFWQVWMFIAAGLYPHEKRYVHYYLPLSLGLFLGGVFLCEIFVIPRAVEALLWFNEWIGLEPDLRLNEWLGFAILMPLVFGFSFQTPLVMLFLERIGILDVETYREKRRVTYFVMAIFAAVITPSTDPISMILLWAPMCALFELGIWMCMLSPRPKDLDIDVPESEDMVEV